MCRKTLGQIFSLYATKMKRGDSSGEFIPLQAADRLKATATSGLTNDATSPRNAPKRDYYALSMKIADGHTSAVRFSRDCFCVRWATKHSPLGRDFAFSFQLPHSCPIYF